MIDICSKVVNKTRETQDSSAQYGPVIVLPVLWFISSILAAVVNLSHSKCEKRTKFAQTTDSFTVVFSACNQFDVIMQAWLEPHGKVQNNQTHISVSHEASSVEV